MSKKIEFHQLTSDFYIECENLIETIDKDGDKGRGYGVLLVLVQNYKFAIPLRSRMHIGHKDGFTTKIHKPEGKDVRHGLDYSKAIIITDEKFISTSLFFLKEKSDYVKINKAENKIINDFEKYILKYIMAVKKNDKNVLRRYRFSTLQNYHKELGC